VGSVLALGSVPEVAVGDGEVPLVALAGPATALNILPSLMTWNCGGVPLTTTATN